jgi:hypothetical protein
MRDATTLYVAAIIDDATVNNNDAFQLGVDVNKNSGDPDTADRLFEIKRIGTTQASGGFGTNDNGRGFTVALTPTFTAAATQSAGGFVVEMAVPLTDIGSPTTSIRAFLGAATVGGPAVTCPAGANVDDIATWEDGLFP